MVERGVFRDLLNTTLEEEKSRDGREALIRLRRALEAVNKARPISS